MFYLYLLTSLAHPDEHYIGFKANLKNRVKSHNEGRRSTRRNNDDGSWSPTSLSTMGEGLERLSTI